MISNQELMNIAKGAAENAYAPYSKYRVGAALLTKGGRVYKGCNVENSSYGATVCAERTAVLKAVSEGDTDFLKIAIFAEKSSAPCGVCRQVLAEFSKDICVIFYDNENNMVEKTLGQLLPHSFEL